MKSLFIILFIAFSSSVFAVEDSTMVAVEMKLVGLLESLRLAESDQDKERINSAFRVGE